MRVARGVNVSETHQTSYASAGKKKLLFVVVLTLTYLVAEVIGSFVSGSLALLADAGHMLTDAAGLILALLAIMIGERKANGQHSYGFYRAEILASLANAVILIGISLYILFEAYQRLKAPTDIQTLPMISIAIVGLVVNLVGMYILKEGAQQSLNMKGAYFEVLSDMLTSIGVIAGAVLIYFTGWQWIDPVISAGIGLFIFPRTWALLKESVGILLEGSPAIVDLAELRSQLLKIEGVKQLHDLHVWVLTSGVYAMTVHVVCHPTQAAAPILNAVETLARTKFSINHTTVQVEPDGYVHEILHE